MKDFTYSPNSTIGNLKDYATRGQLQKAYDEGINLQPANHVHNVDDPVTFVSQQSVYKFHHSQLHIYIHQLKPARYFNLHKPRRHKVIR